ncbi:hypothetical protein BU23DRAFT_558651 [Bimuria novae-zelandiae CBS 107.79]|uniref:SnoaL-like domain-containing protein n=1 Tax=Bimuria novae-zelandiae CBS 107.79 TaxID=1447943 RepID=A0A6A5UU66_9PLEO|nr:hypothetical protein BU23DRAFT_558651 [Bimuria novae-zelandiae CBS 107.79]
MKLYASEYPSTSFDPKFKRFFEDFYAISDSPEAHDEYVDCFTKDATLIMASKKAQGSEEIFALRKGLWEKVAARAHNPTKIFPFGPDSNEVMLHGTVHYRLKAGDESDVDWAARARLVKEGEKVKMEFYQVYLDTGAQSK